MTGLPLGGSNNAMARGGVACALCARASTQGLLKQHAHTSMAGKQQNGPPIRLTVEGYVPRALSHEESKRALARFEREARKSPTKALSVQNAATLIDAACRMFDPAAAATLSCN